MLAGAILFSPFFDYARTVVGTKPSDREALFNPDILRGFSHIGPVETPLFKYDAIRTFYRPHQHLEKLPDLAKLPLLVFVHGLGGSIATFAPLLRSLSNIAPCFGVDFPGCGLSGTAKSPAAYTTEAFAVLLKSCVQSICHEKGHPNVIFVGHSMGCSLAAMATAEGNFPVAGLIAICPKASPPTVDESRKYKRMLALPDVCLDVLRFFDRWGGTESRSVRRLVPKEADLDLKRLQLQYNIAFPTMVWKATMLGLLPSPDRSSRGKGLPGREIWSKIQVPLFLIAGEGDVTTPATEIATIASFLNSESVGSGQLHTVMADSESVHSLVVRSAVLPKPASHALLYDHATYRTLAGLIEDFLARHISEQLSLGWQLQHLTTTGKWDVKNLKKWESVLPVSGLIANIFRALKTLRERDAKHTPSVFVPHWTGKIFAVIDISHETPIYNTRALDKGGIQYHKFPTVSKLPPSAKDVQGFIALVDRLREEIKRKYPNDELEHSLGTHCHYGRFIFFRLSAMLCAASRVLSNGALPDDHGTKLTRRSRFQPYRLFHYLLPCGAREVEATRRD